MSEDKPPYKTDNVVKPSVTVDPRLLDAIDRSAANIGRAGELLNESRDLLLELLRGAIKVDLPPGEYTGPIEVPKGVEIHGTSL